MAVTTFATLPDARRHWPDSVDIDDARLTELLAAAFPACERYAPALPVDAVYPTNVPAAYTLAQVMQAREIYQAQQRGEQDVIGVGDYAIRSRPLIAAVKSQLRPQRGRPGIG
jgi:hypothetical protein